MSLVENKESLVPLPPGPMVPLVYKNMSLAPGALGFKKGAPGPLVSLVKNKESLVPLSPGLQAVFKPAVFKPAVFKPVVFKPDVFKPAGP